MPRILLVEDEIGALAALKRALARAGFDVLVATNLPDALSAAEHDRPDALLLSAGLQGETAASLVEAIRVVDLVRPLVVLGDGTGTGEPSLPKPVDPARLIDLLAELLPASVSSSGSNPGAAPTGAAEADGGDTGEHTVIAEAPPEPEPAASQAVRDAQAAEARAAIPSDLARRRELAAKALAEAQARRRAAEAARAAPPPKAPEPMAEKPPEGVAERVAEKPAPVPLPGRTLTPPPPPAPSSSTDPDLDLPPRPTLAAPKPAPAPEAKPEPRPEPKSEAKLEHRPEPKPEPKPEPNPSLDAELFGDLPKEPTNPGARAPIAVRDLAPPPSPPRVETPPRPQFPPEGIEIPLQGTLEKTEPAVLLVACHRARLTGHLRLDQGAVQRILYFADGRLAGAGSTSAEERLEALSYRRGLITREQQRLLRAETQIPTRRLALLMVERSYLKPAELFPLVQERVEEIIYEACGGFEGSYYLYPEQVPDDERVALSRSPIALATEGIRRKYLMERLMSGLGGPATLLRQARIRGPELSDFGLTARERRLAQAVDGLRNIEELLFESGIEPLPGLKTLYALLVGRALEIAVKGLGTHAAPDVEARIDLSRVGEKYSQVRSANYFEVLGVSSNATAYEISQAYDRLSREFQPARYRELRRPELPGQLEEIQRVLAEARDVLVDEGLRDEYRAHLRST